MYILNYLRNTTTMWILPLRILVIGMMILNITGCLPSASRPASEKNYQLVSAAKLGNASFASDYYNKDVESNVKFVMIYPGSVRWFASFSRYHKQEWMKVATAKRIGLVIPKASPCASAVLDIQAMTSIHVWGTVIAPISTAVGSVIVVDKCEVG